MDIKGSMKKSETCPNCYVDVVTEQMISPCRDHKDIYFPHAKRFNVKKHDAKLQLDMGLKVGKK